jgi:hypothetical protein
MHRESETGTFLSHDRAFAIRDKRRHLSESEPDMVRECGAEQRHAPPIASPAVRELLRWYRNQRKPIDSNSEDLDRRKLWVARQAIPQIDGEANITGPQ